MGARGVEMQELVGRTINRVFVSEDEEFLKFETDVGLITFHACGDCCSESWFADILGIDALLDGKVRSVDEIPLPNYNLNDGRCRQDVDEVYGYCIRTNHGSAVIAFRNSSNGYYGGSVERSRELPNIWSEITKDWSA